MRTGHSERGFALLVLLLVGVVIGISTFFSMFGQNKTESSRAAQSADHLTVAKAALIGYATSYREQVNTNRMWGYLPCPDENNDGAQDIAGPCSTSDTSVIGRLPYRTLGLQDLRDHTGECLWYIVSASHKTMTSSLMNWDLRGNLKILDSAGNILAEPDDADGGAVAAIIAPGPPLSGQSRSTGNLRCSGNNLNGFNNWIENTPAYVSPAGGTVELRQGAVGSPTHNDRLIWITAKELYSSIPRHSDLLGTMLASLKTCLDSRPALPLPDKPGSKTENTGADPKWQVSADGLDEILYGVTGFPAKVPAGCAWQPDTFNEAVWKNWKDHVRYVACKSGTNCLSVGPNNCSGALLLGGRKPDGSLRTADEKTTVGYFEDPNRTSLNGLDTSFAGANAYDPSAASQDLALCLSATGSSSPVTLASPMTLVTPTFAQGSLASLSSGALTLGDQDVDAGSTGAGSDSLFGCAWFDGSVPLGIGLRAYLRFQLIKEGQGFVFTLIDADRNPSPMVCGAGGKHLGYAGLASGGTATIAGLPVEPLRYPKIGLEIDTWRHAGANLDANDPNADKGDPALPPDDHLAITFWGRHDPSNIHQNGPLPLAPGYTYDDNAHGVPNGPQTGYTSPSNPAPVPHGMDSSAIFHLRLEVHRNYPSAPGQGGYTVKAWLVPDSTPLPAGLSDVATDLATTPGVALQTTVPIFDLAPGVEAFRNIRLGFTNSASGLEQEIRITNFEARSR